MTSRECESDADVVADSVDPGLHPPQRRVCKHCTFSTSNTKEFLHHQLTTHSDHAEDASTSDMASKPKSASEPLSPSRHDSIGSGSQPPSPQRISDSDLMEGELEDEVMLTGELDDRDHGEEELVIGKAVLPIRTYTCQDCGMSTTSARVHLYHQKKAHNYDFIIYECDICDYATRYKQKLPRHRKCHFNNLRPGMHRSPQIPAVNMNSSNNNNNINNNNNNNNTMMLPKKISGFDGPVFPGEPFIGELQDAEMDREMNNRPMQSYDNEDIMAEPMQVTDNTRVGKLVSATDPKSTETIQLVDEYNTSSNDLGEGELQIDMGQVEEEQMKITPMKEKLVIKEGNVSPSVLKPKPKRTTPVRQWVDPAKYITLTDEEGIKYSCSKCGNVYKWRKSLSKHWKEKHDNETPPPLSSRPKTQTNVLTVPRMSPSTLAREKKPQANSTQFSPNRSVHSKYTNIKSSKPEHTRPQNYYSDYSYKMGSHPKSSHSPTKAPSSGMIPKPAHSLSEKKSSTSYAKYDSDALDLSVKGQVINLDQKYESHSRSSSANSNIPPQDEPLDFSAKSSGLNTATHFTEEESYYKRDRTSTGSYQNENPRSFQCSRCAYVAVSTEDFKRHFNSHSTKPTKFEQCAQCNAQFAGVDDLNRHFVMEHQEQLEDLIEEEESLLKSHLMAPPISQQLAAQSSKCMVCSTPFSSNYDLARHFNQTHSSLPNPYIKNNYLGLSSAKRSAQDRLEELESKKRKIEISGATSFAQGVHSCNMCGYSSTWRNDVTLHMRKYHAINMTSKSHVGEPVSNDNSIILPTNNSSNDSSTDKSSQECVSVSPATPQSRQVEMDSPTQASSVAVSSQHQQYLADIPDNVDLSQEGTVLVIPEAPEENIIKDDNSSKSSSPSSRGKQPRPSPGSSAEMLLPYKCSVCEYRARWPSEITQHMKNHSDEKPYCCPRCSYRSKWKWDVVKHLKRCGGGTIKDVIDTTKTNKDTPEHPKPSPVKLSMPTASPPAASSAPPNVTVVPGTSLQTAPKPQSEVNDAHTKTPPNKQPVFRSIINQGQYHCLECPFVGSSPAELKRHVILHSDEKPFSCNDCSYSSRWKCDLKKHLRTYNHQPKVMLATPRGRRSSGKPEGPHTSPDMSSAHSNAYSSSPYLSVSTANPTIAAAVLNPSHIPASSSPSPTSSEMSEQSQKSVLYQCEKCPYATYKKNFLDSHMKIHGQRNEIGGKLKCKQCEYEATDLPSFLQHKLTHSQMSQDQMSAADDNKDGDSDGASPKDDLAAHSMRHRRKPIRQYKCSKCPYVCFKKNGLEFHETMHEPRGEDAHKCLYCDYNVYNLSLLKQHLRLHPEHHQEQWGEDGTEEHPEGDAYDPWGMQQPTDTEDNGQSNMDDEEEGDNNGTDGYMDEDEENMRQQVVTQEMSIKAASAVDNHTPYDSPSDDDDSAAMDLSKKSNMFSSSTVAMFNSSDYEDRLPPELWSATYQCKKCPFLTQHRSNYMKHIRMHGTNNKFTCEWCDWSIDRLNLLYRHAKCVHPEELTKQEKNDFFDKVRDKSPVVLNVNPKPKKIKAVAPFYVELNKDNTPTDLSSPKPASTNNSPVTTVKDKTPVNVSVKSGINKEGSNNNGSFAQTIPSSNSNSNHTVPEGVIVATGMGRKRKKLYTCRKCGYSTDILSNIQRHCEKHGQMARYMCDYCDYALDRQNLLWQHMKLVHKVQNKPEFMSPQHLARQAFEQKKLELSANADDNDDEMKFEAAEETVDDSCIDLSQQHTPDIQYDGGHDTNQDLPTEGADIAWKGEVMQMYELNGTRVYRCAKCKYTSPNITNCSNHMKQHGAGKKYTCEYCDYSHDQVHMLYHHMKNIHPNEVQNLEAEMEEDESLSVEAYLNSNYHKTDSPQPTVSLLKTETPPSTTPFAVRSNDAEGVPTKRKLLECHICPFKVKSKDAMTKHLSMHEQKRKYTCTYCDYSVDRMNLMYQHVRVHSESSSQSPAQTVHKVKPSKTASELGVKSEQQLKVPPLKIVTKPNNYIVKSQISRRIRKVKNRVRYGCSKCPYVSFCKTNIAKHRKLHIIRSKFKCHQCNYSATRWFLLNQHIKCHEQQDENAPDDIVYDSSPVKSETSDTPSPTTTETSLSLDGSTEDVNKENDFSQSDISDSVQINKSRTFMCKHCPFGTNSSFELKKHSRLHELSLKYKCDYCSYSLDKLNLLYQHRKLHSKQEGFNVSPAPRTLLNETVWVSMQRDQLDQVNKVMAQQQGKDKVAHADKDVNKKVVDVTENGHAVTDEAVSKPSMKLECKICSYRCKVLSKFKVHLMLHGVVRKFICDHCNWSSDRVNLLYQHRQVHRMETNFVANPDKEKLVNKAYVDTTSSKSVIPKVEATAAKQLQTRNNNTMSDDERKRKSYQCHLCPFSCDGKQSLSVHKNLHENPGQYQCKKCSYSVSRLNLLYQHEKLHNLPSGGQLGNKTKPKNTKKRLKCPKCPYHSHSRTLLDLHSTMHASGRKYTCQFCDYSIDRFNLLQQHMKVHTDNNSNNDTVKTEELPLSPRAPEYKVTPTSEKARRFACERCPYATTSRPNFETHKAQHSTKNKLQCSFCDYSIGRIDHMTNHIKLHLPDSIVSAAELDGMIIRSSVGHVSNHKSSKSSYIPEMSESQDNMAAASPEPHTPHKEGVFTCQYCDREFDNEQTMQRHEAQHLIGY